VSHPRQEHVLSRAAPIAYAAGTLDDIFDRDIHFCGRRLKALAVTGSAASAPRLPPSANSLRASWIW
jgi:hypothetical protein